MDLAETLRTKRKAVGLTQQQVAVRADLGLSSYREIEKGRANNPHIDTLRNIATALNVPLYTLLEEPTLAGKA